MDAPPQVGRYVVSDGEARMALYRLLNDGRFCAGRHCFVCNSDLAPVGAPTAGTPQAFAASTGRPVEEAPGAGHEPRQGGHDPTCPIPTLLRWAGFPEDAAVKVRDALGEPMGGEVEAMTINDGRRA